jgi:phosphoglycerate dehydrogenase-like enzyme
MRIHIQNLPGHFGSPLTMAHWEEAARRAGIAGRHDVSLGETLDDFARVAPEIEALVTATGATKQLFPVEAPKLKVMLCTSAGLDSVPFDKLPPGVQVLNNRGVHAPKAGEFGIMALLMLASHMPAMVTNQRAHRWHRLHSTLLAGRHVTVVGLGSLGGAVAERASQFGMRVTGVRARPAPHAACERVLPTAELDAALPGTEFLVLACPLTDETRNILDRRRIGLLPKGAGVVNIGRGPLVEQDALCDALESGALGGAVLDVFVPEPVPPEHRLWDVPNLIMTPHVSSDDHLAYNARSMDVFVENLAALEAGKPLPNLFDRSRGY